MDKLHSKLIKEARALFGCNPRSNGIAVQRRRPKKKLVGSCNPRSNGLAAQQVGAIHELPRRCDPLSNGLAAQLK